MSLQVSKESPNYDSISYQDILNCKKLTDVEIEKEWSKLKKLNCKNNTRSFCGNKIIYHYVLENMLNTRRDKKNYKLLSEIFDDEELKIKMIDATIKAQRRKKLEYIEAVDIYECYRFHKGSINTFKAGCVKWLINRYKATKMLDFTAGWGGRLLGARASNIEYIGIETNTKLKPAYDEMISKFGGEMIYDNCMNVDFSKIDYDFVLTSPPYINLEKYEMMTEFSSKELYYKEFLIPMINKAIKHIRNNGVVCINISNPMYNDYIKYGGVKCKAEVIALQQQLGGKKNKEGIYVFN